MKKRLLVIAAIIISCIININVVNGAEIDCTTQNFECISCTYEPTGVNPNQRFTYYAMTDGRGTVTIDYTGTQSGIIRWSASTISSYFVNNNKLTCPAVYMKNVGGQSQAIDVSLSRKTNYITSTLIDSANNGKPFIDENVSTEEQAKTCNYIPIVMYSSGIPGNVTRSTYYETNDEASVSISGDKKTKNLELPGKYSAASSWQNVSDDDIYNCLSNLIVGCFEQDIGAYGDKKYTCYLDYKTVLDDRIETDSQHQLIPESGENHNFNPDIKPAGNTDCNFLFDAEIRKLLNNILKTIQYAGPVLVGIFIKN